MLYVTVVCWFLLLCPVPECDYAPVYLLIPLMMDFQTVFGLRLLRTMVPCTFDGFRVKFLGQTCPELSTSVGTVTQSSQVH